MAEEGYFTCPNCGNMITDTNTCVCPNCTYDFGQLIDCTYLDTKGNCYLTGKPCKIKGLDYESCQIYINKFHLNKNPD